MASLLQIEANRKNSQASTGPVSVAGKTRSARNARRHGLSIPVWHDRKLSADAEELANEIAGPVVGSELKSLARAVAGFQIDLIRIRQARQHLMENALSSNVRSPAHYEDPAKQATAIPEARSDPDKPSPAELRSEDTLLMIAGRDACSLSDIAGILNRMDRYERRALSRRQGAIKTFDAVRQANDS
jgi:hypothetical protein